MGLLSQVTGEPCDTETVKHGLVGGGWKSAYLGNSLAAYPTHVRFDVAGDGNQGFSPQAPSLDPTSELATSLTRFAADALPVGPRSSGE
jgi:hypothetical protein